MTEMQIPEDIRRLAAILAMREETRQFGKDCDGSTLSSDIERALAAERERCAKIEPEPDIEEGHNGFQKGYVVGFYDCLARVRAAIRNQA